MKMKKTGVPGVLFMVICVFFAMKHVVQARDLDTILQTGELRACIVAMGPSFATFQDPLCLEDCMVSGPVPRTVEAFVHSLGADVRTVFHRLEWDEQFHDAGGQTVREGIYTPHPMEMEKCDVYPSHLTKNEWRLKKLDFAILFLSRMMVITRQDRLAAFTANEDLAGKTMAVGLNTSHHTWALEHNGTIFRENPMQVVLVPHGAELNAVVAGQADFTLRDAEASLWEIAHRHQNLGVAFPVGPVEEIGWAFRKEDHRLRDAVQAFFDGQIAVETSELNRIWKEEYGVTLSRLRLLIQATQ